MDKSLGHLILVVHYLKNGQKNVKILINLALNPNFHCPGPIGPWVFWMLIAQNIIMSEKYEKIFIPSEMSSDSFLLQGSLCKLQFCATFYEISTHYPKSKVNLDLRIRVVEAWSRVGNLNSPHVSTTPNQLVTLRAHLFLVSP